RKWKWIVEGSFCSRECRQWDALQLRTLSQSSPLVLASHLPNQTRMDAEVYGLSGPVRFPPDPLRMIQFCSGPHAISPAEYDKHLTFIQVPPDDTKYEFEYVQLWETTELWSWPGPATTKPEEGASS